jgi:FkbM family methyltransferase
MAVLMSSPQFKYIKHADCADNMYPLYNVIQYNKLCFLSEVARSNPFSSTHLMWMDGGSCRDGLNLYRGQKFPLNYELLFDNKVTHFTHNKRFHVNAIKKDYFLSQIRNIQGTSYIVPLQIVELYKTLIQKELEESMTNGFIGSDEKVYDAICQQNKELIELVKCGWFKFYDIMATDPVIAKKKQEEAALIQASGGRNVLIDCGMHECGGMNHMINKLNIDENWNIYAFEANPKINCDCIPHEDFNVEFKNKAVWTRNGSLIFKQYGDNGTSGGSLVGETGGGRHYHDFHADVEVECFDFYEFLMQFNSNDRVYIKMDIEHSEYDVLEHVFRKGWPDFVKEIWLEWHATDGKSGDEHFVTRRENLLKALSIKGVTVHYYH